MIWVGSSLDDVRAFPADVRRSVGQQLRCVQLGLMPGDWKAMRTIGRGVYELRVRMHVDARVFYIARFGEAVYVLHAFQKQGAKTNRSDIELARARLQRVKLTRKANGHSR